MSKSKKKKADVQCDGESELTLHMKSRFNVQLPGSSVDILPDDMRWIIWSVENAHNDFLHYCETVNRTDEWNPEHIDHVDKLRKILWELHVFAATHTKELLEASDDREAALIVDDSGAAEDSG